MEKLIILLVLITSVIRLNGQNVTEIPLLEGEKIWSGIIKEVHKMPFDNGYKFNFYANNIYNQLQPLLLSNKGLYNWREEPYAFEISHEKIIITENLGDILSGQHCATHKETRKYASDNFFPSSGKMPDEKLFSSPQYNTWIELTYNQNRPGKVTAAKALFGEIEINGKLAVTIPDLYPFGHGIELKKDL